MRTALILLAVGGGFWAYREGYFDQYLNDDPEPVTSEIAPQIPAKPASFSASGSKEMDLLLDNIDIVQPWARTNLKWVAAMMWAESRGNAGATSGKGARGLMQVMPDTAADLVRWGFDEFEATSAAMYSVRGSIYFGTAYLEYLSKKSSDREWIARAYNAGPGGRRNDGTWPRETEDYLKAIKQQFNKLTGTLET